MCVEIEGADLSPWQIVIGPNDGSRFYRTTTWLGVSYSGREAPPALLRALDAITQRLATADIDDLRRALGAS